MIDIYSNQPTNLCIRFILGESEEDLLKLKTGDEGGVLTLSMGPLGALCKNRLRRVGGKACKVAGEFSAKRVRLDLTALRGTDPEGVLALLSGVMLANNRACSYKRDQKESPQAAFFLEGIEDAVAAALPKEAVLCESVLFARELVNAPANYLTPESMAVRIAQEANKYGVECQTLDKSQLEALGMGALLAVGESATHEPKLIVLRYKGGPLPEAPLALVGKGVTCDTGGYCLKSRASLRAMFGDMAGAAAVAGTVFALARNQVSVNVVAVIPAVENRISPDSFLPGDIISSMSGRSIAVENTDAEGRLLLADGITYAIQKENAGSIVDIATLTGAVVTMFGFTTAGAMSNHDGFYSRLNDAAEKSGEQYWRLPTFPEFRKMIDSPIADLCNMSSDGCGTITAGMFIREFAEEKPWIHLDIAGTSWVDAPKWEYQVKGATGAGVTTLYELCCSMGKEAL